MKIENNWIASQSVVFFLEENQVWSFTENNK